MLLHFKLRPWAKAPIHANLLAGPKMRGNNKRQGGFSQ